MYLALAEGLNTRRLIPADEDYFTHIKNNNKDYYRSIYYYNDEQYKRWKETGSLAGITDVYTDTIVWDFDCKEDTEKARQDAIELCTRLVSKGIAREDIQIAFSGLKGYSVEIKTNKRLTPAEFRNINLKLAEGLETNDTSIFDHARIIRIVCTKHNKSGLYKFPLTLSQLCELPSSEIKKLASDLDNAEDFDIVEVDLPDEIYSMREAPVIQTITSEPEIMDASELDFKFKPKGFSNCKFAIMNGFFPSGKRSNALMALGATCRAQGYPKEVAYNMLKAAARMQGQLHNTEPFSKEEIWNNIVEQMYKSTWKGAQYSCKNQPWLKEICESLGANKCKHESLSDGFVEVDYMSKEFEEYSLNIEKNTIKTGLKTLDDNVQLTIGMPVGLLGAPSSGKTSLSLDILSNTSLSDISSVFFSMDMYGPLVYMKQIMRTTGFAPKKIHDIFKHDIKQANEIKARVKEEYKNVKFSLKAGHTVQEMRDIINDHQERTGDKVKLVLIDYLECISGPYSDSTANTSKIAGELRDFATEMGVCGITLVQPPKSAGDASCPLTSMRQIKGASMLEQSFRVILGIYRDGFGPNNANQDRFITVNALKNTMGELFSVDHYWEGRRGKISEIDEQGEMDLAELRKQKAASKASENDSWG